MIGENAGTRREQLTEAWVVFRYILGAVPPAHLLKLYVRGMEAREDNRALHFSHVIVRWPWLLKLLEPLGVQSSGRRYVMFYDRLNTAALLVDCDPRTAALVYDYEGCGVLRAWWGLVVAMLSELSIVPIRVLMSLGWRFRGRS